MNLKFIKRKSIDIRYKKLITLPILSAMLIACGGGGGGGGSGPSTPNHQGNVNPNIPNNINQQAPNNNRRNQNMVPPQVHNNANNQENQNVPPAVVVPPIQQNRIAGVSKGEENVEKRALIDRKNDENKIVDVAVIDTFFRENTNLRREDGSSRIEINNQQQILESDKTGHGTLVSTIVANYNKNAKIFAYSAGIRGGKLLHPSSLHFQDAHDKGARIFNNSYGADPLPNSGATSTFANIIKFAQEDSIFVWAAGNESKNNASPDSLYPILNPKAKNGWITVMATPAWRSDGQDTNQLSTFSNKIGEKGKTWGITAKGEWYIEDEPGQKKHYSVGTSYATPRVTAAVANVWDQFPWMTNHLVTMTILSSASKPGTREQTEAPDATFGWGILNEQRALKGPGRLDKLLLTDKDKHGVLQNLFTVNLEHRNYTDKSKLTWSNDMAGDAGIHKTGDGTLYLSGANTYKGSTWVEEGAVSISKSLLNSKISISQNGTFIAENDNEVVKIGNGKTGLSPYIVTNNGGSLNVYGKGLRIHGDYKATNGGRIAIDIDKSNLQITGNMDMGNDGYVLADIKDVRSVISKETQTKIIITANEIKNYDGSYKVSPDVSRYINLSAFYMDNQKKNIYAEYNRNSTDYVLKALGNLNASSLNTAKNLDVVLDDIAEKSEQTEIHTAAVKIMNAKAHLLPQMIDSLSGEIHSSSQNIMVKQNQIFNRTLSNRIASLMHYDKSGFWIDGIYAENKIHKDGYSNTKAKTKGTQIGLDGKVTDEITLGLALTKGNSTAEFNKLSGNIETKSDGLWMYGSYDFNDFYISSRIGASHAKSEVKRTVIDQNTNTSYTSKIYNLYTEVGTMMMFDTISINPFLASEFNKISRGKFEENVVFGINSNKKHYNTNSFTAGVRSSLNFDKFSINSHIAHSYTPNPNDFNFNAKFNGSNKGINIKGVSQSRHDTFLGLGLSYNISDKFTVDSKYNLSIQDGSKESSVFNIGVIYNF
ncbi:autotransporter domain-containing protein [Campylobacter sp.]|uniref:autotransporter domain-containing protein n=1 Tax=Campylobacter sp. TaxID=205 RepID=UPI002707EBE4|nr:autotransporter domain-containing protein [Campylobacter sp.]